MPSCWWTKRPTKENTTLARTLMSQDIALDSGAALALDKAQAALASDKAEGPFAEWIAEDMSDKLEVSKFIMSVGLDILHDPAGALQADGATAQDGSGLADMGLDVVESVVSGALVQAATTVLADSTVRRRYLERLYNLPTIIHPEVSFAPDSCYVIAIIDWRIAVVLPGNRDRIHIMSATAIMSQPDIMSWAKRLRDRQDVRLSKTQDQMLAALISGEKADAGTNLVAAVVSPPWPPTTVKVHKKLEFRGWRYRTARDRAELSWKPPIYNGSFGETSIHVLTFPPPRGTAADLGAETINMPHPDDDPRKSYEYVNLNSVLITGLDAGTAYTFAVIAANALGTSHRSVATLTL